MGKVPEGMQPGAHSPGAHLPLCQILRYFCTLYPLNRVFPATFLYLISMLSNVKAFLVRNYVPRYNRRLFEKEPKPLPLDFWLRRKASLLEFTAKKNILTPSVRALKSDGAGLRVERLRDLLAETTLGIWALDQDTIALLWEQLQQGKPEIIMECGSGVSTLMFARYFQDFCPEGRLISFEQDMKEKQRVEAWLQKHGLAGFVNILYTPLNERGEYRFDQTAIDGFLQGKRADWLMIDGPNGADGSRSADMDGLLPSLAPGARWYADDAFRDGELDFLQGWQERKEVVVEGIYPVGKGLATGRVR